ncbi:hypothetical protein [Enhygromyxa salina]|uniref:VWFA domain-containing protein n=1 Tax=Enhygromyxa salina TaxID=215803 RepID=A0A2S9YV12_9BACT|nr:hypothetical protein [Enhygromyxa salina]PRQ08923.1 hypothetical protein ENSA7_13220 [Enhygromyxa salina]
MPDFSTHTRFTLLASLCLPLCWGLGCGGNDMQQAPTGDGVSGVTLGEGDGESDGDGQESSSDSLDDGGDKLDLGNTGGGSGSADDGGPMGECQKVDLLFVIDNSGSMEDEQASLVASFGGFVAGIQAELSQAESYHIGVVTTDAYSSNGAGCNSLGALVTSTGGDASSNANCQPFSSGARYLDETEPDLATKFSCIAQVGISGSGDEIQAQAGYQAVSPAMNAPGACNEGFIRDDALLVVVIISDENDQEVCLPFFGCMGGSEGDPVDWFEKFQAYKNGIQENIVVLALVGDANNSCGADNCSRLIALTNWFFNGSVGDICAPSYETFFNDAIAVIDDACDNFTPPE